MAIVLCCAAALSTATAQGRQENHTPPNVLLVLTDDQGWGDMRSHGNDAIDTPTLDRLADEGARFERFFVSPVCAPTRASLLTGRYHLRCGVHGVTRARETMRSSEVTLAEVFRSAGYATGCFGKWHNGAHYPEHPTGQGFDQFFGFCAGHWNNYFDTTLEEDGRQVETTGFIADVITDRAIEFIRAQQSEPFFCYVPYNTPHSPWQLPDRYFEKYAARGLDTITACAYGLCENLDDNMARLLLTLDEVGVADRTIVIFLTDNGPNSNRFNGGMRGRKGSIHEGGVRVPLLVRYPGVIAPGTVIEPIAAHIDLFDTLLDLTGAAAIEGPPRDGRNLAPLLRGERDDAPPRLLFTHWNGRGSVRSERYRSSAGELHDLVADPGQQRNLAAELPDVQQRMQAAYDSWLADVSQAGLEIPATAVGHPEAPSVVLPGHEAQLHPESPRRGSREGLGIRYNGRAGFAHDWVTGWTDRAAYPWWDLNVVRGGRYRIALKYLGSPQQLPARLAIEIGASHAEIVIRQPHNPPPRELPNRVEIDNGAHIERDGAWIDVGTVSLVRGRARLVVRGLEMTPASLPDIQAVRLVRAD